MGLTSLNTALSGLSIAQRQIEVISNNVANVGTEGYTRKILPQNAQVIGGIGSGVSPGVISRSVDLNLSRTLWTQVSSTESKAVQVDYLQRIEQFHGSTANESSIAAALSDLYDAFVPLADDPTNPISLRTTINQAQGTADSINNLADYITTLRNDVESEINVTVETINGLLDQIADLNSEIARNLNLGQTTAAIEDQRDLALKQLSGLIETSSYVRGDGVMIVQTNRGVALTGAEATHLSYTPTNLSADTLYPDDINGLYVGDARAYSAVDITSLSPGGKLEGLLTLRDETFPKQMAQLDELAHKMALRFQAQGLALFTDDHGLIPADTAPDLTTDPETSVTYVGFASVMQVNQDVINDPSLLQAGTESGATTEVGSNALLNRILDNVFGDVNYQTAFGNVSLETSTITSPQNYLSNIDLNAVADATAFIASTGGAITSGVNDTFRIVIEDAANGIGPINLDISLGSVTDGPGNFADDIIDYINTTVVPGLSPADQADLTTLNTTFSVSTLGQLNIVSDGAITMDGTTPANAMGTPNLALVGLDALATIDGDTLQEYLGLRSTNSVEGIANLNDYPDPTSFLSATNNAITATNGTFRVTFEDPDLGIGPINVDVDLTVVPDGAGDFGDDIVDYINTTLIPSLPAADQTALSAMNATFSIGANGQLAFSSNADITINATAATNPIGTTNLEFLGLGTGTTEAKDPYFDISVGSNNFTRIHLEPTDTEVDLLAKLNAVPGLAAQYGPGGELQLRPGNDFTDPDFGGSLQILSGTFETSGAAANTLIAAGTIPDGINMVSALFGSFTAGSPPRNASAIQDVFYGSAISNTNSNTLGFRENFLGANGEISTNIDGATSLLDYAQSIINEHSHELSALKRQSEDAETFQNVLEDQLLQATGVNMDEELSNLIVVQNAYAASAG